MKTLHRLTNLFPFWLLFASGIALVHPAWFTWFSGPLITIGLGVIMLGMGLTLTVEDFMKIARTPRRVAIGVVGQFVFMPLLGWSIATAFRLPSPLAVGLILVACCPGGTASNVISYLAKADVGLSVSMTAVSTLASVLMTPLLTRALAGHLVRVDTLGLLMGTLQVVIVPVVLGVLANKFWPRAVKRILPAAPLVAVCFIVLIVASVVGAGRTTILDSGFRLLAAVFSLHAGGFAAGYAFSAACRLDTLSRRTVSIEVGMQNSGLGVVLARNNFINPLTAVPSAISSVFHSVIGSALAAIWRGSVPKNPLK